MRIYIAGKITGLEDNIVSYKFKESFLNLRSKGYSVITPAVLLGFKGFEHEEYMHICYAMIDVCDAVFMQKDWQNSKGARMELQYAADHQKEIFYEDEHTREEEFPIIHGITWR